jgi:hypothetical protein
MHMATSTRQVGGVTIVDIRGRIVLGEESAALRELVGDLVSTLFPRPVCPPRHLIA